jgi:stage II sporulation protein D
MRYGELPPRKFLLLASKTHDPRRYPFVLPLFLLLLFVTTDAAASQELRVLLGKTDRRSLVTGEALKVTDGSGRTYDCGNTLSIRLAGYERFRLNRMAGPIAGPIRIFTPCSPLQLGRTSLRGALELLGSDNRHIEIINVVELEDYLCGLVNAEISSRWPQEAVKAQVVAARTYAIRKKMDSAGNHHLVATTQDQMYRGASSEDSLAVRAVRDTAGWIMTADREPIMAYYHSCCGGRTDSAANIRGIDSAYLKEVPCQWCGESPAFRWNFDIDAYRLARLLARPGFAPRSVDSVRGVKFSPSGRVLELEIASLKKTLVLTGEEFRKIVGYQKLKSTGFEVAKDHRTFRFTGTGFGHGMGACQWGMKGMAEKGYSWREILKHFYTGIEFARIRPPKDR